MLSASKAGAVGDEEETASRNPFIPAGLGNDLLTGAIPGSNGWMESNRHWINWWALKISQAGVGLECLPKALSMKNNSMAGRAAFISPNDSSILMIM